MGNGTEATATMPCRRGGEAVEERAVECLSMRECARRRVRWRGRCGGMCSVDDYANLVAPGDFFSLFASMQSGARPTSITAMKFIVAHTLAFLLALAAFALYIVSFNTPFYSIAKKCKLPHRFNSRVVLFFFLFVPLGWFFSSI